MSQPIASPQTRDPGSPNAGAVRRLIAHGWLYVPAASGPIGGGLIKLGHGSTLAAASVGLAPYVICASLYAVFVMSYIAAVLRYLCGDAAGQQAMERLIRVSANAVVAILTLNASALTPDQPCTCAASRAGVGKAAQAPGHPE
jgi:hypothetical protein